MQEVNVEKIMEEIRAGIKAKGYRKNTTQEQQADLSGLMMQMRHAAFIPWRRPLPAGIRGAVKRVIQKCTGFLIAPVTEDQTRYNQMTVEALEQMYQEVKKLQDSKR